MIETNHEIVGRRYSEIGGIDIGSYYPVLGTDRETIIGVYSADSGTPIGYVLDDSRQAYVKIDPNNGTVTVKGLLIQLIDPARGDSDGCDGYAYYAHGQGSDGKRYAIKWELLDSYDQNENDESNACDWDHPVSVIECDDFGAIPGAIDLVD